MFQVYKMKNTRKIKHSSILLALLFSTGCATGPKILPLDSKCSQLPVLIEWHQLAPKADSDGIIRPVLGYRIYIKASQEKTFQEFVDAGNTTKYEFMNLKPGQEYDFRLVAYNEVGTGSPSNTVRKKVCDDAKPAQLPDSVLKAAEKQKPKASKKMSK